MIDREHDLPISKAGGSPAHQQGSVYYLPRPVKTADLAIMRRLDQRHLESPFAGSRMFCEACLAAEGARSAVGMSRNADAADGDRGSLSPSAPTWPEQPAKRSPRICCAGWQSRGRTGCGRWTSPTFRWRVASSIWPGSHSIGSAAACCRGGCRSRWKRHSASRRRRMLWLVTASRRSPTRIRARSSRARLSRCAHEQRHCDQRGR